MQETILTWNALSGIVNGLNLPRLRDTIDQFIQLRKQKL
jgi:hypothetical protein